MFWSISFQLMPGEDVIDDTTQKKHSGVRPAYSVFLTNRRAIFRFDGLGSTLSQSFFYNEIFDVKPHKRLFINYLHVKAKGKDYFINTSDADYWAEKIMSIKESLQQASEVTDSKKSISDEKKEASLLEMLSTLRKNSVLSEEEYKEKILLLDSRES